jgi:hypothetical protein
MTRFLFPVWRLRVSRCGAPSLTRGRVCNLLYSSFWALPEQSLWGPSPTELTAIFYCPIWDSPNLEGQVPVFISPRIRVVQLYPWALGSLLVASPLAGLRWRYSNPPSHGARKAWIGFFWLNIDTDRTCTKHETKDTFMQNFGSKAWR